MDKNTPRSNKPIRTVIIEAAWIATRNDPVSAFNYNANAFKIWNTS